MHYVRRPDGTTVYRATTRHVGHRPVWAEMVSDGLTVEWCTVCGIPVPPDVQQAMLERLAAMARTRTVTHGSPH